MRKRIIHVLNWEKYQARSDKELPWCKLWGALFKKPWFQNLKDDEKFCTITILDLARQFNNKLTEESIFKGYLRRNYGLFMEEERVFKLCKSLADNGFLSDSVVGLEGDKIRVDKIREEIEQPAPKTKPLNEKVPENLEAVKAYFLERGNALEAEKFYDHFSANGWKVGGKSPMQDWKAAARGWITRSKSFNTKEQKNESGIDRIKRIAEEARRKGVHGNLEGAATFN